MSLERRIAEALHAADDYQPSVDLFSRLHRSIEDDLAHRRRVHYSLASVGAALMLMVLLFGGVASQSAVGRIIVPRWSLELAGAATTTAVLIALGPLLWRLGGPLLDEVFHLNPPSGQRFSRLLDIAYYLFFGGMIVGGIDVSRFDGMVVLASDETWSELFQAGRFLLTLGLAHVANLALLPIVGLLFTSLTRRARRREAGAEAPPLSPQAQRADRVVTWIVNTATVLALTGALGLIGLIGLGLAFD